MNLFAFLSRGSFVTTREAPRVNDLGLDVNILPSATRTQRREMGSLPQELREELALVRPAGIAFSVRGNELRSNFAAQSVLNQLKNYQQMEAIETVAREAGFTFEILPAGARGSAAISALRSLRSGNFELSFEENGITVDLKGHCSRDVAVLYNDFKAIKSAAVQGLFSFRPINVSADIADMWKNSGRIDEILFTPAKP